MRHRDPADGRRALAYFADVFTPATWAAFVADGGRVTAFSRSSLTRGARRVRDGDRFVCYLQGKFRFVGALEARSDAFVEETPIWGTDGFPVRVRVEPYALFSSENALPLNALEGKLSFYEAGLRQGQVPPYFQGSPRSLPEADGLAIWRSILAHEDGVRSMQRPEATVVDEVTEVAVAGPRHGETQALLAEIGLATGCDVWIPRADRQNVGRANASLPPRLINELPFLFPGRAQQVVQNIDAIWLHGSTVVAAFEVENTTSIYSGLLRMSDLVALMPNISFPMFIVAPESRRSAVRDEITRPTFASLNVPLNRKCGYIASEELQRKRATLGDDMLRHTRPEFIDDLAERF